ncbi:chorismate synthase [Hathewaya histolytica]|uniref:Chorismate synthase n=1 Tax=Hathewaya histolytica TaxID=1498 RepID=A0A4U9QZQ1_HATHI|nr:chorismate synthase [Hathewaya histolytica]VTQ84434.1 chorismate synthase [Hathewaya histolytica]
MSGVIGNKLKLSIFGESHGEGIGIVIDGLPAGVELNLEFIKFQMKRRAPGRSKLTTPRHEADMFNILSGVFEGKTTGTPLCAVIFNKDTKSKDYSQLKSKMRPSHSDYPAKEKYLGFNDYRGGGHFSGRITAPLVFAGAIAIKLLESKGIYLGSHIKSIYNIEEEFFDFKNLDKNLFLNLRHKEFPVMDEHKGILMKDEILKGRGELDSRGGIIEIATINLPVGLGSPFFDSVESRLSHMIFSVPGVKGIEFGSGFNITKLKGSEANDPYGIDNGKIVTLKNNNGGVVGGLTTGMPLIFRVAIKPTSSIGISQDTVDIEKFEEVKLEVKGRHDPCIVPRAVPVIESVTALTILDLILEREGEVWKI